MKKVFQVWSEGYRASGDASTAFYVGSAEGSDFQQACEILLEGLAWDMKLYNKENNSYWGCQFYPSETEARKSFG